MHLEQTDKSSALNYAEFPAQCWLHPSISISGSPRQLPSVQLPPKQIITGSAGAQRFALRSSPATRPQSKVSWKPRQSHSKAPGQGGGAALRAALQPCHPAPKQSFLGAQAVPQQVWWAGRWRSASRCAPALPPSPTAKFPGSPGSPTVRLVGRAVAQRFALRSSPATRPQSKISGGTIVHYVTVQVITLQ